MKKVTRYSVLIILTVCVCVISCKKELCENCADTNKPPIANAGPDQVITLPTDSISLDGSASGDPDGSISEWRWTKISGPASFTIINSSVGKTVAKNPAAGLYQFELKVTDNGGLFAKDTIQVNVVSVLTKNHPPVANAGPDQSITLPTNTLIINGSGSTDPENNIISYTWAKISGPVPFSIVNTNAIQTQIINLVQGVYQFELKVNDAGGLFSNDTIHVTVNIPPSSPVICDPGIRPLVQAQLIPIGTLSQKREAVAVAVSGNKIVLAGGYLTGNAPASDRVDIYDIVTGNWTTAQLSHARAEVGVAILGNKIFLAGGIVPILSNGPPAPIGAGTWYTTNDPSTRSAVIDIYDISANTWRTAQLSHPRAPTGGSVGNKVVFAGGDYSYPSSTVDNYDAASNSWSTEMLSFSRRVSSVTSIGNKIFFAGGDRDIDGLTGNIDIYDATSNTWTADHFNPPFDQGWAPTGIAVGNKNYWAGGQYYSQATSIQTTDQVVIRDERTHTSTFACLFQPNSHFDAVVKNNKIVFFTGWGRERNKFDIYDIATNSWSIGVLQQKIFGASIISVNNTIYVGGGIVNGVLSNQVWKLEF